MKPQNIDLWHTTVRYTLCATYEIDLVQKALGVLLIDTLRSLRTYLIFKSY